MITAMPSSPFAGPSLSASSTLWNTKSAFWVFVNDSSSCRTRVPNRTRVFNPTGCEGVTLHDKGDLERLSCIVPMAPCNQGEAELNIWNREVMQEVRLKKSNMGRAQLDVAGFAGGGRGQHKPSAEGTKDTLQRREG